MTRDPALRGPEPARPGDLPLIRALLERDRLPASDLTAEHLRHFVVLRSDQALHGVAGLEVHGSDGLLRSVVVDPALRSRGFGERLVSAIEQRARTLGLSTLYLLTTTAAEYFARRGWQFMERGAAPAAIRASPEFAALCPAGAQCLYKGLAPK